MRFIALIAWFVAALWGLYMLAVWLIENDATDQRNSPSRLPLPVIVAHVTLAVSGLVVWVTYLLLDRRALAWTALGILGGIALLGFTMFARWIPVYRATGAVPEPVRVPVGAGLEPAQAPMIIQDGPPEGNFPLFIVVAHGTFAVSTVVLVLLSALGIG
jgi:manganese efflux pump family protein